jgi:hypothetical protein
VAVQQRNRRKRSTAEPGTLKRTGLHRLECEESCGAYVYATVAQLEQHGMPQCSCGARFIPERVELALHVLPADDSYRLDVEQSLTPPRPGAADRRRRRHPVLMTRRRHLQLLALAVFDRLAFSDHGPWRAARVALLAVGPLSLFFAIGEPA